MQKHFYAVLEQAAGRGTGSSREQGLQMDSSTKDSKCLQDVVSECYLGDMSYIMLLKLNFMGFICSYSNQLLISVCSGLTLLHTLFHLT